jgi:23S rRNA pseudouridine2605 synthase
VLASAGVASRRACEELIAQGRVEVDGRRVTEQGIRIDPSRVVVRVDGQRIATDTGALYLAANKPRGMVSTMSDPQGRPCLADLVERVDRRLFHVGRLDADSDGLLLLTNDGRLAHRLAHPSFGVTKTYVAQVRAPLPRDLGRRLRAGIELEDGLAAVDAFRVLDRAASKALIEVVIHEGRKHIVRRLLAAAGHPVLTLTRTRLGPVRLGELRPGKVRSLTKTEIAALFDAVDL